MDKPLSQLELEAQEARGELAALEGLKSAQPDRYKQAKAKLDAAEAALKQAQAAAPKGKPAADGCVGPEPSTNPTLPSVAGQVAHPVCGGGDPIVLQATPKPVVPEPTADKPADKPAEKPKVKRYGLVIVAADSYKGSLAGFQVSGRINEEVAKAFAEVRAKGGLITSSGAVRGLNADVGLGRSATSFHYSGLAFDLYMYGGMQKLDKDAYVVTQEDDDWNFRVFAHADQGDNMTLQGLKFKVTKIEEGETYGEISPEPVTGTFCDVTAIFESHGFHPIGAKDAFKADPKKRHYKSAEWWHFQATDHLTADVSTFGDVLLELYTEKTLQDTPPWQNRSLVYNGNGGFKAPAKTKTTPKAK